MGIVFLTMLASSAALGLPGAYLRPLGREFGWSTAQISSALAVRFVLYGLMGPFAAILMERFGIRRIVCTALLLIAGGMLLITRMTALWQLVALWGLALGIGSGLTALVLGAAVANRWFDRRRGLVLGILTASSATGQLIFLPLASSLIAHYGWRIAVAPIVMVCFVVALLALLLCEDRPGDIGLAPYGAEPGTQPTGVPWQPGLFEPVQALGSASRSGVFWVTLRHVLRVRPEHERPDTNALHFAVRGLSAWPRFRPLRFSP